MCGDVADVPGEQEAAGGDRAHREQADDREAVLGVEPAEGAEEHPVAGRVVGDAGAAEQTGADGGEGGDQDEDGHRVGGALAPGLFQDRGGDGPGGDAVGVEHVLPGDHTEDADLHQQVDAHDGDDREDDGARHDPARVLDLGPEVGGGVVAEVVVDPDGQTGGEADPELAVGQLDRVGGPGEGHRRVEVGEGGEDHRADRDDHHAPEHHGGPADVLHLAPQQQHHQGEHRDADDVALPGCHARPQVGEVLHQALDAGRHDQRDEQHRRPHEQERHQPPAAVLEGLAQVDVGAAGAGERGAEFGPDQAVGEREQRARDPADDGLRPAEGADHQRDGDERADPAHLAHVDRGGLEEADSAGEACGQGGLHEVGDGAEERRRGH